MMLDHKTQWKYFKQSTTYALYLPSLLFNGMFHDVVTILLHIPKPYYSK